MFLTVLIGVSDMNVTLVRRGLRSYKTGAMWRFSPHTILCNAVTLTSLQLLEVHLYKCIRISTLVHPKKKAGT